MALDGLDLPGAMGEAAVTFVFGALAEGDVLSQAAFGVGLDHQEGGHVGLSTASLVNGLGNDLEASATVLEYFSAVVVGNRLSEQPL